jgi:hypothetical protein
MENERTFARVHGFTDNVREPRLCDEKVREFIELMVDLVWAAALLNQEEGKTVMDGKTIRRGAEAIPEISHCR